MNSAELRQEAYKLYWAHSADVSGFEETDAQALLKELERIRVQEEKANDYVDRMLTGDITDFKFYNWRD